MKNHTKVYIKYFGYGTGEFIPCEVTGNRGADIHHIDPRRMGGSDKKDVIENLIGVTRRVHDLAEARRIPSDTILKIHFSFMKAYAAGTEMAMKIHYAQAKKLLLKLNITEKDL